MCNGGVLILFALFYMIDVGIGEYVIDYVKDFIVLVFFVVVFGLFVCSCGDIWVLEIGIVISFYFFVLIIIFCKVFVGINGGVIIIGIVLSIFGGIVIGIVYYLILVVFLIIRRIIVILF